MSVLVVIYWIVLLFSFGAMWLPAPYDRHGRFVPLVLFIIIGLKLFGTPR